VSRVWRDRRRDDVIDREDELHVLRRRICRDLFAASILSSSTSDLPVGTPRDFRKV
jgi:hypothetical protein